jgi:hypothetical protein
LQTLSDPQDAATKAYVDLVKQGLYVKDAVRVASTAPGDLATDFVAGTIIDTYTLSIGDRILIKNQTDASENGIYIVTSSIPTRALDQPSNSNASGIFVFVQDGSVNASLGFICNTPPSAAITGTDTINFTQFTGLGAVVAGNGLSKVFNQLNVNVDQNSIEINANALRIKSTALGTGLTGGSGSAIQTVADQSHVTKLGAINTGTWQASTVQVVYGGTGCTQFTNGSILLGNGTNGIGSSSKFNFDTANARLGIGTNAPQSELHVQSGDNASILLNANSDGTNPNAKPEIILSHTSVNRAVLAYTRTENEYANNVYPEALIISNYDTGINSNIQIATQQQSRVTVSYNGNVGINTSNPNYRLHVKGTLTTTDINCFQSTSDATGFTNGALVVLGGTSIAKNLFVGGKAHVRDSTPSTNSNTGALIVDGGLTVKSNQNASNFGNGGGLTVVGGASVGQDLYVGGQINGSGSSSSTFAYLTLTATDEAINQTTGCLVTFGGITIQSTVNASNVSNGGSLLTPGGGSFGGDLYVGGNEYNYGYKSFFGPYDNLIVLADNTDNTARFSIDRKVSNNDFSISRYSTSGGLIEYTWYTDYDTGKTNMFNTSASQNASSASLVVMGGISVNATQVATSLTSGGGVTNVGGQSIVKNLLVGGDTRLFSTTQSDSSSSGSLVIAGGLGVGQNTNIDGQLHVSSDVTLKERFNFKGNGLLDTITNSSGQALWNYFGPLNDLVNGYCDLELNNGITGSAAIHNLRLIVSINNTNTTFNHQHSGTLLFTDPNKTECCIYKNGTVFHLFVKCPAQSSTIVRVNGKTGSPFVIDSEGSDVTPNGSSSGFTGTWQLIYTTNSESNLAQAVGNLTVEGSEFKVCDNVPVFGYNNVNVTGSRDLGLLFQRFQLSNDSGTGDIVTDVSVFLDSLPNQTTATSKQIRFSNLASSVDGFYTGWWIKLGTGTNINQVRKIVKYTGEHVWRKLIPPGLVRILVLVIRFIFIVINMLPSISMNPIDGINLVLAIETPKTIDWFLKVMPTSN